jgi:hypothetical protein
MEARSTSAQAQRYFMQQHVHMCPIAEGAILLDLRRGEYLGLTVSQVCALADLVAGWPADANFSPEKAADPSSFLEHLHARNLVTDDRSVGKAATPIDRQVGNARLLEIDSHESAPIRARDVCKFLLAVMRATTLLRCCSLDTIVRAIRSRKNETEGNARSAMDLSALREALSVFYQIRPAFYSWRRKCLYDSLVLISFLSSYGLYPEWMIGVKKSGPFMAHSWVQQGDFVLNGPPEYLRDFTPILAV